MGHGVIIYLFQKNNYDIKNHKIYIYYSFLIVQSVNILHKNDINTRRYLLTTIKTTVTHGDTYLLTTDLHSTLSDLQGYFVV